MKEKTRKLSIRAKIILLASILIILICIAMGISSYQNIYNGMVDMGIEQADTVAEIAIDVIDAELVAALEPGCENTEGYQTLLTNLRAVQKKYGILYLYTLYTDGSQLYYGVDTDSSELQASVGDICEDSYEDLASAFAGEDAVLDYIDYTEYGDVISVYKPIKNSEGKVIAILGSDYDASGIVSKLNNSTKQVIIMTGICIILAIILFNIIVGNILKSLQKVNQKIYDLVHSKGDLTQKLDVNSGDELELIANNVNLLLEYIREIMLNIGENSTHLKNSSTNVANNLSSAEINITDVSATMEEMSAAMEETNASLNQVNESIVSVYNAIESISCNANLGKNSSDEIMKKAAKIHETAVVEQTNAKHLAQEMSAAVNETIEKSRAVEEISTLTTNIIAITEQTNLLALNANIEAARAGDAGRGFAIVADEIGKLASNSAETAAQIQTVSAEVIASVNELAEKAEQMLTFMDETSMSGYKNLLATSEIYKNDVSDINNIMQQFAVESANVKHSIDTIKESVSSVNTAVTECTNDITNVTKMSVDLTASVSDIRNEAHSNMDISNQLNTEVNKFTL